ncbi:MAG: type II secretion system secretin GspD [Bdellovibrionota bacterium]
MEGKNLNAVHTLLIAVWMLSATATSALAQAQAPAPNADRKGFSQPGTNFGNSPFANPPGGEDDFFEDDDFEETEVDDISEEILRQRMEQRMKDRGSPGAAQPGASRPSAPSNNGRPTQNRIDFGQASQDVGATSMGGGAKTKITPGDRSACLKLDPFRGIGPDVITNFDFPDADIVEIAKTLGRLTCLNFILDKDVKGRISVVSNSSITVGDAWKAFLTALDVNGFTIIPSGKYLRIARQRDAKDKQIKTYSGEFTPNTDLYITRVLPLKYISADEVARVFRNFMPPNTRIIAYDQTNTLIITDTGSNIKKIVDMVQLLDIEGFDEGLEVIRVKYASAQDIAKLIDQLLPGNQGGGAPAGAPGGIPRFRGAQFQARKTKEGGVISHVIPDDRTNSLIVSANAKGLDQVKQLIGKLDTRVSATTGSRIHVRYLQYGDAEQIAQTLNNLASGGGGAPQRTTPIPAPGAAPPMVTSAQLFEGSIKIAADKSTNSLVVTATPTDFLTISRVISKLDVPRDQVYVEAIIMEMTIDKTFQLGTNIAAPKTGVGFMSDPAEFASFLVNPLTVPGLVLGFQGGKGSQAFKIPGTNDTVNVSSVQGLIKALQRDTNSNVLATPQILTLDNQEAQIEISENIPIPQQTAVQGAGVQTSIQREKIALSLEIKPQINKASDFVKLDIKQKLEDIDNRALPEGVRAFAFATSGRQSKTTVVVQDGDTVAMGGLMRNNIRETTNKVPLLGDIPLLGWLFRSKTTSNIKQNLIVFITPKIIKQYENARKILDKKLRQRDEFIEKNVGGEDPFLDQKLEMIKGLPPVEELKNVDQVENTDEVKEEADLLNTPSLPIPNSGANSMLTPPSGNDQTATPAAPTPGNLTPGAAVSPQTLDGATAPGVINNPSGRQTPAPTNPSIMPQGGSGATAPNNGRSGF